MKHIFVVDDERDIRELIRKYLEKEGHKVTTFSDGTTVYDEMIRLDPDLIVMDIMMPTMDGLDLCRKIRKKSEIPIIFVSARGEEIDRILGLELGADDYLAKPFSPRELLVRIKNIFRRLDKQNTSDVERHMKIKDVKLYQSRRYVEISEQVLKLTTKEFDVLSYLMENKNMPIKREQLLEKIWGFDYYGENRIIDDVIKRIRKKLKDMSSDLEITTVWGFGYKIEA